MHGLTPRQKQILNFIQSRQATLGVAPSLREIAKEFGFRSMTAAADHVRALRRKGILVHRPRIARAHTLAPGFVSVPRSTIAVPVLSSFTGASDGRDQPDDFVYVDSGLLDSSHPEALVAIAVYGDSMSGRHIMDGDIAIVDGARMPVLGDVVAVALDGEYVLKTYVVADDETCLRADGLESGDLIPAFGRRIRGVVVGLIRRFGLERRSP
jgi:repressor LexA